MFQASFKPNPSIFAWPYLAPQTSIIHSFNLSPISSHVVHSIILYPLYTCPSILHFTFSLLPTHSHSHTNHIYALPFILSPPLTVQTYFSSKWEDAPSWSSCYNSEWRDYGTCWVEYGYASCSEASHPPEPVDTDSISRWADLDVEMTEIRSSNYDPEGEYVRHWLPELARVPIEWIHHPWDAPFTVLEPTGQLGSSFSVSMLM